MEELILWRISFIPIEFRVKEEIGKDARQYRSWWNDRTKEEEWKY